MKTFSVAEQTVTEPVTGTVVRFTVDPHDSAIVHCTVHAPAETDPDYLRLSFHRNGMVREARMVDWEVEEDARLRAEAQARLARAPAASPAQTDEEKQAAADAAAKQAEDDKSLLASEPKVSKYVKGEDHAKPQPERTREPARDQHPSEGNDQQLAVGGRATPQGRVSQRRHDPV